MPAAEDAIIVIDDFLQNPHELREHGVKAEYPPYPDMPHFPGRNSVRRYGVPGLDEAVTGIVGHKVEPNVHSSHAKFRLCPAGETGKSGVHIDNCNWTGVLYLSLGEKEEAGTDFFRHIPTNTMRAPVYDEDWSAWGHRSVERLWNETINPHTNDPSKWELVRRVPMKFNRLVLFQPWRWHNAGQGFGDRPENARLIYLLSYNQG